MASPRTRISPEEMAASRQSARDRMRAGLHPEAVAAANGEANPDASAANSGQDEAPQGAGDLTGQYPASPAPEPGNEDAYRRLASLMQMAGPGDQQGQEQPPAEGEMPMLGMVQQMMLGG